MEELQVIKSVRGGGELKFSNPEPISSPGPVEYFLISLKLEGLDAAVRVYTPPFYGSPRELAALFDDLAKSWRGWTGEKSWGSLEDEITFCCTCDKLGHIAVSARLRNHLLYPSWEASGVLEVEAGQLDSIARAVRKFLRV